MNGTFVSPAFDSKSCPVATSKSQTKHCFISNQLVELIKMGDLQADLDHV